MEIIFLLAGILPTGIGIIKFEKAWTHSSQLNDMDYIYLSLVKCFKDPGWWLTAIVVAIVIAPLQKWVTDTFYSIAGKSSSKWKERQERKSKERLKLTLLLANNEALLILESIITLGMFCLAFFIGIYVYISYGDLLADKTLGYFAKVFVGLTKIAAQGFCLVLIFLAARRSVAIVDAYLLYRRSRERNISVAQVLLSEEDSE
jgi:hypothetical protein